METAIEEFILLVFLSAAEQGLDEMLKVFQCIEQRLYLGYGCFVLGKHATRFLHLQYGLRVLVGILYLREEVLPLRRFGVDGSQCYEVVFDASGFAVLHCRLGQAVQKGDAETLLSLEYLRDSVLELFVRFFPFAWCDDSQLFLDDICEHIISAEKMLRNVGE